MYMQTVSDVGLGCVCDNCPCLERLSVSSCEILTDLSLKKLGASCVELKLLEASGCSLFTDAGFKALAIVSMQAFHSVHISQTLLLFAHTGDCLGT